MSYTRCQTNSNQQEMTEVLKIPLADISGFAEGEVECLLCSLLTVKALNKLK